MNASQEQHSNKDKITEVLNKITYMSTYTLDDTNDNISESCFILL